MLQAILRGLTALLAAAVLLGPALGPRAARAGDDDGRQDVTIGNPDRTRMGTNERGDNQIVIEAKPNQKQQVPNMGQIYVVPQVKQGGTSGTGGNTVIIPVNPQQTQDPNSQNK